MKGPPARTEQEMLLQEYLRLKPSRAMDRLLSEHQLDQAYHLYQILQQKIKKNTSQLRSALTEKYQSLVDCSNLLNTIKSFTDQIQQIQKDISASFKLNSANLQENNKQKAKNIVNKVEQKIYQKKYSLAMRQSYSQTEIIQENELMYLPFLRIQILESLQSDLVTKKFTNMFISEVIDCLSQYIHNLTIDQQSELVKNQRIQNGVLSLIAEEIQRKNGVDNITDNDIIEIIFKCKLLSLNNSHTNSKNQDNYIFKFFYDIYQLILQKQNDSLQIQHLSAIFCRNIKEIQVHLSETFIKSNKDGTVSFQYELYIKLVKSNEFMDILDKLYSLILKNYQETPTVTLKDNFLNLWQNFYISLLNLLFDKIDPLKLVRSKQINQIQQNIPLEMAKYFIDEEVLVQSKLKDYQTDINIFLTNINELIKKSQQLSSSSKTDFSASKKEIIQLYSQKIQNINGRLRDYCENIAEVPSIDGLRSLIMLFILGHQFNSQVNNYHQKQYLFIQSVSKLEMKWDETVIIKFNSVFHHNKRKQNWSVSFDQFFMNYHTPFLREQKGQIIQRVIILILQGIMIQTDSHRANLLLEKIKKSKQPNQKQLKIQQKVKSYDRGQLPASAFWKKKNTFGEL